jgi:amidase
MHETADERSRQVESLWSEVGPSRWSRREFLALLGCSSAAIALTACESKTLPLASTPTKPTELIYTSATELARAIRSRKVSSEEVVNAYLQHVEAVNPKINALVQLAADTVRAQARAADAALARGEIKGPLHGVPITVGDLLETAEVVSTAGTQGRTSFVPTQDATVVARLRNAGAILLGKTNVPELGLTSETDNLVYKWTDNPYDRARTPGGSGGGEAAIIAAGGSPLGLGSDVGASLCVPCHFCGIVGLRPTNGRVPRTGHFPPPDGVLDRLWQVGPLARFVEDLCLTLPILTGTDGQDPEVVPLPLADPQKVNLKRVRVAFYTDNGILPPTPEIAAVIKTAATNLAAAGSPVEENRPAGLEQSSEIFFRLIGADGGTGWQTLLARVGSTELHRLTRQRLEFLRAYAIPTPEFWNLQLQWDKFRSAMLTFMGQYDVILCPASAYPALLHGTTFEAEKRHAFSYTSPYALTGWPSVTVRGGTSPEGLPLGVQVIARPWREDVALAVAQHIETALGGWQPPSL